MVICLSWIRIRILKAAGSGSALRRTAGSGPARNECGSTALRKKQEENRIDKRRHKENINYSRTGQGTVTSGQSCLTTDTKVALDLSAISLPGESPLARLGFFLGLLHRRRNRTLNQDRRILTSSFALLCDSL